MTKKVTVAIVLILAITGIATATVFFSSGGNLDDLINPPNRTQGEPKYNYLGGGTLVPGEYREPVYNPITGDWRPQYEGLEDDKYDAFFGNLPAFPEDFYSIVELVYDAQILDYGRISDDYWKQPEFYVGWYGCINDSYIDNDPLMWTPEGYGIFPIIKEVHLDRGEAYQIDAYLRTGFGTESYQGIIFRPELPATAKTITGQDLFENPEDADKHIHPRITNPDNPIYEEFKDNIAYDNVGEEDWFVVLEPTYQLHKSKTGNDTYETGFPEDWVRMMHVEIEIDSDCPPGMYVVSVDSDTPCFDINQEFYYAQDHEYYGGLYYPAGRFHKSNKPHFQIIIEVT